MKFVNKLGYKKKIRRGNLNSYYWITVDKNEIIDIPADLGYIHNLSPIKEKEEKKEVHNPDVRKTDTEISKEDYKKKLLKIRGVGPSTADDIINIYPTERDLLMAVMNNRKVPIRNDIARTIKNEWK